MNPETFRFDSLTKLREALKFPFSGEGWFYRDNGKSTLLILKDPLTEAWVANIWNNHDPRPHYKRIMELQVHNL